jgi:hypothetical protein
LREQALTLDHRTSVVQTRFDVVVCKSGVRLAQIGHVEVLRQVLEHKLDRHTRARNDWLTHQDGRIYDDPRLRLPFTSRHLPLLRP